MAQHFFIAKGCFEVSLNKNLIEYGEYTLLIIIAAISIVDTLSGLTSTLLAFNF